MTVDFFLHDDIRRSPQLSHARNATLDSCATAWRRPSPEPEAFRDSLARLASGVAVAACWTPQGPKGLLISSLTGLSTEPPRILFCVRKGATAHEALLTAEDISLSILAAGQRREAERFSRTELTHERFGSGWTQVPEAPPVLADALAHMQGAVRCRIDAGSHTIFILDVSAAVTRPGAPLVYFERAYANPSPPAAGLDA
jgi:flavin reductase